MPQARRVLLHFGRRASDLPDLHMLRLFVMLITGLLMTGEDTVGEKDENPHETLFVFA